MAELEVFQLNSVGGPGQSGKQRLLRNHLSKCRNRAKQGSHPTSGAGNPQSGATSKPDLLLSSCLCAHHIFSMWMSVCGTETVTMDAPPGSKDPLCGSSRRPWV